jgi:FMN-dependent NADH-azoreductase
MLILLPHRGVDTGSAMKLLHIDSSALGAQSVSRELSAAIVARFTASAERPEVRYRDLAERPLPHWMPGADERATAFDRELLAEFLAADVVVLGAPMYNFAIASQLKAWIDRIAVAGATFRYTEHGPEGLAGGKRVIVAISRGGLYPPQAAMDFQEPYLRAVFAFMGITDLEFVRAEGLNLGAEPKREALRAAHAAIGQLEMPLALAA